MKTKQNKKNSIVQCRYYCTHSEEICFKMDQDGCLCVYWCAEECVAHMVADSVLSLQLTLLTQSECQFYT